MVLRMPHGALESGGMQLTLGPLRMRARRGMRRRAVGNDGGHFEGVCETLVKGSLWFGVVARGKRRT